MGVFISPYLLKFRDTFNDYALYQQSSLVRRAFIHDQGATRSMGQPEPCLPTISFPYEV